MIDIKNRFCRQPWSFVEVHSNGFVWNCCPSWIKKPLGNILEQSWEEVWNGEIAQEYRQSMIDSTFKNCIRKKLFTFIIRKFNKRFHQYLKKMI